MTNVEALKNLYAALGGNAADVADAVTNVDVLNAIAGFLGGEVDATTISEAIENIVPVAPTGGGDIDALIDRSITEINSSAAEVGINAFYQCTALLKANFLNATVIGDAAFKGCSQLKSIDCPKATEIGGYAFDDCSALEDVNFPMVTRLIGQTSSTFRNCSSLARVEFPSLITLDQGYAFSGCTALKIADFPVLTAISGSSVFDRKYDTSAGCTSLEAVILRAPSVVELTGSNVFRTTPIESGTGYIYVPDDLVDSYKAMTNWSTYANQIKGLSELPTE